MVNGAQIPCGPAVMLGWRLSGFKGRQERWGSLPLHYTLLAKAGNVRSTVPAPRPALKLSSVVLTPRQDQKSKQPLQVIQAIKQLGLLVSPKQLGWHVQNGCHPGKGQSFRKGVPAIIVLLCNDCCDYSTEDWCAVNKTEKDALGMPWDDFQPSPHNAVPDKALDSRWCPPISCTVTHRGGWAAENPEPRSAWSFLPPFPHEHFSQSQTTLGQFLLRQPLLDCSKQCV